MNTFWGTVGRVALVAIIIWVALEIVPALLVPIFGLAVVGTLVGSVVLGLGTVLAVVGLGVGLAALLVLAPVAIPVLAIIGIVHLCRGRAEAAVPPVPGATA